MLRSFTAHDLVTLPRLSVPDAIALGTALLTRAQATAARPPAIDKALARLGTSLAGLRDTAQLRLQETSVAASEPRDADRALDNAWSAAYQWCSGWSRLPHPSHAALVEVASKLLTLLFATGVKFTQFKYRVEWAESQARLDIIARQELAPLFAQLGGQAILEAIQLAHDAYGKALGLTAPEAVQGTSVRNALDAFQTELRQYVVRVSAHAEPDEPATQALADDLLAPLLAWKTRTSSPAASPDEPSVPDDEHDPATPASPAALRPSTPGTAAVRTPRA